MRSSRGPRLALSLLAILWIASPARAQVQGQFSAVVRLVGQTAWTTPDRPLIRITIQIRNDGDSTIADPVIVWTLGSRVTSRVEYETALVEGPASIASAETIPVPDELAPGASMEVPIRIDSSEVGGIVQDDSGVYPLELELRSGDQPIASLTTAAIHIFQDPQQPVLFSLWTEVATPVAFGPDGALIDPGFEAVLESRGGIVAQVEAIVDLIGDPDPRAALDLNVSPAALDQLRQAADGYQRSDGQSVPESGVVPGIAAETLLQLQQIAASPLVRMHAMPFAAPRLPALLQDFRLRPHLENQWRMGDEMFERILGEQPDRTVARPPGLAFEQKSVDLLAARGATTILGAADSVERPPQPNDFAPPPVAALTTASGRINLLMPDPGTQSLLIDRGLREDPVLAAQVILGELATVWKEEPVPGPGVRRGLALDLIPDLPATFWGPAVRRLSRAPFLEQVHAEDLPGRVLPPPLPATLRASAPAGFSSRYVDDLASTGRRVSAFGAILEEPAGEADLLRRSLLYAEASQYIGNEGSGHVWIDAVNELIDRTFSRLKPDTSRVLTFTSRSGTIPLRMGDPGGRVLNVRVELASGRVDFLDGDARPVRLDQANEVITFRAEVKAAGPSNIDVFVKSPNGVILSQSVLVVRSTAVNPIALIITIGAGLVLVGLWSRRLFRRRSR